MTGVKEVVMLKSSTPYHTLAQSLVDELCRVVVPAAGVSDVVSDLTVRLRVITKDEVLAGAVILELLYRYVNEVKRGQAQAQE